MIELFKSRHNFHANKYMLSYKKEEDLNMFGRSANNLSYIKGLAPINIRLAIFLECICFLKD